MRALTLPLLLASLFATAQAGAQHPSHEHRQGLGGSAAHEEARRCQESFDRVVAGGRGFGMAFAADRHGYPGPLHVLELRDALALTPLQESRARAFETAMFSESRPKSAALLAAEERLDRFFASGQATETEVARLAREVERLRGEVRLVHLRYHLKTRDLLTEEQRTVYHERRWGGAAGR